MSERAEWVLRIDITENDSWDEVPEILHEIADTKLTDLPLSETFWDSKGRLLGVATVEVAEEES